MFKDKERYEKYLKKNSISVESLDNNKYFDWSDEGYIILDQNHCVEADNTDELLEQTTACKAWYLLKDNETMGLLKRPFGDIYRALDIKQYNIAKYNNILVPQIAKQFGCESAEYFFAKVLKDKYDYILTIDFKEEDEHLIQGEEVLDTLGYDINELNINKILMGIEDYLIEKGYRENDIEKVRDSFIKQSLLNRFIKQEDEHNRNWGIITDWRNARLSPVYDVDCSFDIGKQSTHVRKTDDGSTTSLDSFLNQFKDMDGFKEYIKDTIEKFDIDKAFEDAKELTNIEIPNEYKNYYKDFVARRFFELKSAYKKTFELEKENDSKHAESIEI